MARPASTRDICCASPISTAGKTAASDISLRVRWKRSWMLTASKHTRASQSTMQRRTPSQQTPAVQRIPNALASEWRGRLLLPAAPMTETAIRLAATNRAPHLDRRAMKSTTRERAETIPRSQARSHFFGLPVNVDAKDGITLQLLTQEDQNPSWWSAEMFVVTDSRLPSNWRARLRGEHMNLGPAPC